MFEQLEDALSEGLHSATRSMHSSIYHGEDDPKGNPYDRYIAKLDAYKARAEFLRDHECEFDDDGFCMFCNLDGNG